MVSCASLVCFGGENAFVGLVFWEAIHAYLDRGALVE
jgi:hypothetical protein